MKQRIQELVLVPIVCLLLYYLYWSIADDEFMESILSGHDYPFKKLGIDALVCLMLTYLSMVYSRAMMFLMNGHETLQKIIVLPTLVLFVLDMLTAWGMSELTQRLFCEPNLMIYFQDIFVFGLLATLVSSIKSNSIFWQKKIEMEHGRNVWENKVAEAERVMAKARLHNLQSQVNPHFFFNNLSALSSLISTDTKSAKEFVSALSQIYRYILKDMKQELVPLTEELQLVREYAKLLRIRHGKSVQINLSDGSKTPEHTFVPPTSIQHLVENAVKHNAMTAISPLTIDISFSNGRVSVRNNRNPLTGIETNSGTGLVNLQEQLKLFGVDNFEKVEDTKSFCISFPLIQQKQSL